MKKQNSWYALHDNGATVDVLIYGDIGEWDVSAKSFIKDMKAQKGKQINLRINSGGGSVTDGIAIYNYIRANKARVTAYIDAAAFSMASVIALAAKETYMAENALMMIHKPWSISVGDANDLRKQAEVLDKMETSLISAYTSKTGKDESEIQDMLAVETWMDASEALEHGFIDGIIDYNEDAESALASVDLSKFDNPPDRLKTLNKTKPADAGFLTPENTTTVEINGELNAANIESVGKEVITNLQVSTNAAAAALTKESTTVTEKVTEVKAADEAVIKDAKAKAKAEEMSRVAQINAQADVFVTINPSLKDAIEAKAKALIKDENGKADALQVVAMEAMNKLNTDVTPTGKVVDAQAGDDLRRKGIEQALEAKAGISERDGQNHFNSHSLQELARASLKPGAKSDFRDKMDFATYALSHSTSDFPIILSNIANKGLLKGYDEQEETYEQFTRAGSVSDFKVQTRVGLGSFPELLVVGENGEYKYASLSESQATIQANTKGRVTNFSRQMLINDDLGLFGDITRKMGRAARRTIGTAVFQVLTDAANYTDGVNAHAAGSAPTTASFDAAKVMLMSQTGDNGEPLNIRPQFVIVPPSIESAAKLVLTSTTEISASNQNSRRPNTSAGMVEVISDARLTGTAWYFAGNPSIYDGIEIVYLDGNRTPYFETRNGFDRDGVDLKIRHDWGVAAIDNRSLYQNAGA